MKYFYSCPIQAAFMAKYFGMRFIDRLETEIFVRRQELNIDEEIIAYIHQDSLHLLEPTKHDLVDFGWIHPCGQSFHEITLMRAGFEEFCEESTCDYDSHRIIQRNGISFMWPEVEE